MGERGEAGSLSPTAASLEQQVILIPIEQWDWTELATVGLCDDCRLYAYN